MSQLSGRKLVLILLLALTPYLSVIAQTSSITNMDGNRIQEIMGLYKADRGSLLRFYTVPNSPERRERLKVFYREYQEQLNKLSFGSLSTNERVDYILFDRNLKAEISDFSQEEKEYSAISQYIPFADSIYKLEKLRRRGAFLDAKEVSLTLNSVIGQINQSKRDLQHAAGLPKPLVSRAVGTVKGLQLALKSVHDFYNLYEPGFTWWVAEPYSKLYNLLGEYSALLEQKTIPNAHVKDDGSGIIGNPIGREELIRQLKLEMIPYSPEELISMANKELEWSLKNMINASRKMGFGDNWKAALEKVKQTYVPEGRQPEMIMGLYDESVNFLKQKDLLTIPPLAEETWRMMMMSPERQLIAPFFLGGETLLIAYPTNTMEHDAKMMSLRGNNPHFSRAVVHHELIAGHRLQSFMTERYKSYRQFGTPFWSEGWALYWEMVLWDEKFPRSAEDEIGMMFWRMHRSARIIFSLSYHLEKWTPQQCIDFLVNDMGQEKANAEGEVRRSFTGGYGPLYQIAYMVGALQFYSLKKELVDSGRMTYKAFHDAILRENSLPVEMLRAIMTDQNLEKNYKTSWRFYNLN